MTNKMNKGKSNDLRLNKVEYLKKIITAIYVLTILGIFPLVFRDYYFDILVFKYRFYVIVTIIFLFIIFVLNIILKVHDVSLPEGKYLSCLWRKIKLLSLPECFLLIFILISVLSTIQSDFKYEAFWGNEGRYTGCFLLLLYGFSTIAVSRIFSFKTWTIEVFLITGMVICLFGVTDYFQMDILKFKVNMHPDQYNIFASTIGNVNSYTSYVAMVMAVSTILFSKERTGWKVALYYVYMIISFFAIVMGLSDNSYLALGAIFAFLPLYIFDTKTGIKRYVLILVSFSMVIYIMKMINSTMSGRVMEMEGILQKLTSFSGLEYVIIGMISLGVLTYAVAYITRSKGEELGSRWRVMWLIVILIMTILLVIALYDVNILKHEGRYGDLGSYLIFNDEWGTRRGYAWRITLENYSSFPLVHKIFGYGPDTFGILTRFNNYKEMLDRYGETFDSVHNEYLQYFITMGPVSLISYVGFLVSSGIYMVKRLKESSYVMAVFFALLCFAIQAIVNISVPVVSPVMFTLLAAGLAGARSVSNESDFGLLNIKHL